MATAGRVLMIPAGEWKSGSNYGMLDVVVNAGSSYVAKKNINNSTVAPPNDGEGWQLLAQGYDVTNIVTKNMMTGQNVNDANKVPNSALMYAVKQQLDQQNSDLTAAKDDIAKKASTNAVTVLENRLPAGFGFVYKSFVVPKQENESTIFDIYSFVPREARWAVVCQTNGTNVPEVTSTFKGVDDHWKITTRQATTGLFTVSVLFIMPI